MFKNKEKSQKNAVYGGRNLKFSSEIGLIFS